MLKEREWEIFKAIVKEFQETACPVSSLNLVRKFKLNVSPATVRIEMMELEEAGLIKKSHISSGRMPTDEGFKYFIEKMFKNMEKDFLKDIIDIENEFLNFFKKQEQGSLPLTVARFLAEESRELGIFLSPYQGKLIFSGVNQVLKKTEFSEPNVTKELFILLEALEQNMNNIVRHISEKTPQVFIGKENPLTQGENLSMIVESCTVSGERIIAGIIGPKRMNYQRNVPLVDYVTKQVAKHI